MTGIRTAEVAVVYTDGACIRNPGKGGWAWALSEERYDSGFEAQTTNQRMEVTAAIRAIGSIDGSILIVSDSTYLVNCFRQHWWRGWRARGWRNSRGEPVANQDLWRPLVEEVVERRRGRIEFEWVKGHSSDQMNAFVDRLANEAARQQRPASSGASPAGAGPPPAGAGSPAPPDWEQGNLLP